MSKRLRPGHLKGIGDSVAGRYGGPVPIPEAVRPPRLVATDLDGTLVHSDRTISPRTKAAVLAVQEAGAQFVMVTARPPRWLHDLSDRSVRTASRSLPTALFSTMSLPVRRFGPR